MQFDPTEHPHRRRNLLTGEWVLVSPHRTKRPWQGQVETLDTEKLPSYEPTCYLCPGNTRANGGQNPAYDSTFAFGNDFAALLDASIEPIPATNPLFQAQVASGECRVVCYSPDHNLTLAKMSVSGCRKVVDTWLTQLAELSEKWEWVQIFENRGAMMGCSNPHPHGQIWASSFVPTLVEAESRQQLAYFELTGRPLLGDVVQAELEEGSRIVFENKEWLAWVPFWATWPFEILLAPKLPTPSLLSLSEAQQASLAEAINQIAIRYDNLFQSDFPYSMGWHFAPPRSDCPDSWTVHAHFYPPLLRSATVRKFLVGYEMMGEAQRDITPEQAADRLRDLPSVRFSSL